MRVGQEVFIVGGTDDDYEGHIYKSEEEIMKALSIENVMELDHIMKVQIVSFHKIVTRTPVLEEIEEDG